MISFESDYIAAAHDRILQRLTEAKDEIFPGYGTDRYCESAKEKIRAAFGCPQADVHFLVGGTQTNSTIIAALLKSYEGVVAAESGHVNVHESGAVEYTGHKVLTLPQHQGKLDSVELENYLGEFFADEENCDHMVFPGMVYISFPTEYGTLYTKEELKNIHAVCRKYELPLFIDGARLGYGLMSRQNDITPAELAENCDVFYIGGTKVG
ncbi:MAG: aminotransferase class I/II-fold pyridoxal phosphate-dependent enzyme, partial [Christensenellaceae bacterium]|nr:aminotransferase class I/II-fold pyridoxal phosphate-dependent enzyme [Christensenellaceae bacterium]